MWTAADDLDPLWLLCVLNTTIRFLFHKLHVRSWNKEVRSAALSVNIMSRVVRRLFLKPSRNILLSFWSTGGWRSFLSLSLELFLRENPNQTSVVVLWRSGCCCTWSSCSSACSSWWWTWSALYWWGCPSQRRAPSCWWGWPSTTAFSSCAPSRSRYASTRLPRCRWLTSTWSPRWDEVELKVVLGKGEADAFDAILCRGRPFARWRWSAPLSSSCMHPEPVITWWCWDSPTRTSTPLISTGTTCPTRWVTLLFIFLCLQS